VPGGYYWCALIPACVWLQCTLSAVSQLQRASGSEKVQFSLVEVALTLLLQLTESAKAQKGTKALESEGAKSARDAAVAGLLAAGPALHTEYKAQRCVVTAYLRLARGCAAVLRANPAALGKPTHTTIQIFAYAREFRLCSPWFWVPLGAHLVNPVLTVFFESMRSNDDALKEEASQIFVKCASHTSNVVPG
jgi:hypothetical protein